MSFICWATRFDGRQIDGKFSVWVQRSVRATLSLWSISRITPNHSRSFHFDKFTAQRITWWSGRLQETMRIRPTFLVLIKNFSILSLTFHCRIKIRQNNLLATESLVLPHKFSIRYAKTKIISLMSNFNFSFERLIRLRNGSKAKYQVLLWISLTLRLTSKYFSMSRSVHFSRLQTIPKFLFFLSIAFH